MKKDNKDKEIRKDEELTDEDLAKAAGGYVPVNTEDYFSSTVKPGPLNPGNVPKPGK